MTAVATTPGRRSPAATKAEGVVRTARHLYYFNGQGPWPGVTSITRVLDAPALLALRGRHGLDRFDVAAVPPWLVAVRALRERADGERLQVVAALRRGHDLVVALVAGEEDHGVGPRDLVVVQRLPVEVGTFTSPAGAHRRRGSPPASRTSTGWSPVLTVCPPAWRGGCSRSGRRRASRPPVNGWWSTHPAMAPRWSRRSSRPWSTSSSRSPDSWPPS